MHRGKLRPGDIQDCGRGEIAILALPRAPRGVGDDRPLAEAMRLARLERATMIAGSTARRLASLSVILMRMSTIVCRGTSRTHSAATFPALEEWACQHQSCHDKRNEAVADHGAHLQDRIQP